ncbi:MAG: radical SAM protein [Spirochaetes bacterium]|nr:MAG: radical SAM protein [Spirochaetota bacterium]
MGFCLVCNNSSPLISEKLGVCVKCIREKPKEALPVAFSAHRASRFYFGLPESPPRATDGVVCKLCANECRIPAGGMGYCGLRENREGKLVGVSPREGKLSWYHDPLPTNCVGEWVCAGCTEAGFPGYSYRRGPENGYFNLAVFFHACSFNCLFCQNWHFREKTLLPGKVSPAKLAGDIDRRTSCICYFGGDPSPQLPFSLNSSRLAIKENRGKYLRVCWETNGSMHPRLLDKVMDMAIETGGCVKFDLKAWNEDLHIALTGITNRRTLENFRRAGRRIAERPDPPPLIASTLLVPGYIDEEEIGNIARFIASIDPEIPYSLLAFHPRFYMNDLPLTSRSLASNCLQTAIKEGLTRVKIGNLHLLV